MAKNAALARQDGGNFISEWFGRRIYPTVKLDGIQMITGANKNVCPFLSEMHFKKTECWKSANSKGVCTISAATNRVGPNQARLRQDWLVCPHRVIHTDLVRESCAKIFGTARPEQLPIPVSALRDEERLNGFKADLRNSGREFLFFQDKLGGEISVSGTDKNPEMSFDVTLVEVLESADGLVSLGRYGIMEVQTMDFHGSYKGAVDALNHALDLHPKDFPKVLQKNLDWARRGIEGPNIANVFKRTFYQMLVKFQLSSGNAAAGTVLTLPRSVWDSWQPFLGGPELIETPNGYSIISGSPETELNAFICVFDIDPNPSVRIEHQSDTVNKNDISPIRIQTFIKVDPKSLAQHAFTTVPNEMLKSISGGDLIMKTIRNRLTPLWPALSKIEPR